MIRKVSLILTGLFLALLVVGMLLPGELDVERSIDIARTPEQVFPLVDDPRAFNRWSPWDAGGMTVAYSGGESGVGARMIWTDPAGEAKGSQEIVESDPPNRVVYELEFGLRGGARATVELEPAGSGTRVTWGFSYRIGYDIVGRYIGALTASRIGAKFDQGLERLKRLAESDAASR